MTLTVKQLAIRTAALDAAVRLHGQPQLLPGVAASSTYALVESHVLATADRFAGWLGGTTSIRLTPGPIVNETSGLPDPHQGEQMTQLNTGQQFTVECDTEDAAGFDTTETIEWSIDNDAVATLRVSDDTRKCVVVSGAPGSAVLTASLPGLGLSATLAVDVVPAGTATIELVAGDVEDEQPEAPAEPEA